MSNAAEEILSAALLVLRPDTTQQRRNEASNYLTRMIQMDEANLSFVLQLITDFMDKGNQGSVPCNLNLTSFEWDGIKGLLAGLFYKRCRAGRYISNDVDVMTVNQVIDRCLQKEPINETLTLFEKQMCASRCAIAVHKLGTDHELLSTLLMKCQSSFSTGQQTNSYSMIIAIEMLTMLSRELESGSLTLKQSDYVLGECKAIVLSCVQSVFELYFQMNTNVQWIDLLLFSTLKSMRYVGHEIQKTTKYD